MGFYGSDRVADDKSKEVDIFRRLKERRKDALIQFLSMLEKRGMEPVGLRRTEKADNGSY